MSYLQPSIEDTKPNTDCKFCELHHYVTQSGKPSKRMYAKCNNRTKALGCNSIDIAFRANPLTFETSCQNCKEYISKRQLSLF